jgi:hypothetical protein
MAMLLGLLMLTHWLAAITLVPSIFAIIRPKFVERGAEPVAAPEQVRAPAAAKAALSVRQVES